jgi:hypothetical protein
MAGGLEAWLKCEALCSNTVCQMNKQTKIKPPNSACTLLFSIITNLHKVENGDF